MEFLKADRFWIGNVVISVGYWLQSEDPMSPKTIGAMLVIFGSLFLGVKTVDKFRQDLIKK